MTTIETSQAVEKRERGRPTKLTPQVMDVIASSLRLSKNVTLACEKARITTRTFYTWQRQGQDDLIAWLEARNLTPEDVDLTEWLDTNPFDEQPYVHFLHATLKAVADFELTHLAVIEEASQPRTKTVTRTRITYDNAGNVTGKVVEELTEDQAGDWKSSAWMLERRIPEKYQRRRIEQVAEDGETVPIDEDAPGSRLGKILDEMQERVEAGIPNGGTIDGEVIEDDPPSEATSHDAA